MALSTLFVFRTEHWCLIAALPCERGLSKWEVQSLAGYRRHCKSLKGIGAVISAEIPTMCYLDSIECT